MRSPTSGLTLPTGFTLVEGLSATIAAQSSDTFQATSTTVAGTKSGQITFSTNDGDEIRYFNFSITGQVNVAAAPEIVVLGNGTNIGDGSETPSSTDLTDFGSVAQGGSSVLRTFTVTNAALTLTTSGLAPPTGFNSADGLSASIAAGSSDTFQVSLDTASAGTKSGQYHLHNQ